MSVACRRLDGGNTSVRIHSRMRTQTNLDTRTKIRTVNAVLIFLFVPGFEKSNAMLSNRNFDTPLYLHAF